MSELDIIIAVENGEEPIGISGRIKSARMRLGLSREWLALETGISASAIGQWETGKTTPSYPSGIRAARALGVTDRWLAFGEGPQERSDLEQLQEARGSEILPLTRAIVKLNSVVRRLLTAPGFPPDLRDSLQAEIAAVAEELE